LKASVRSRLGNTRCDFKAYNVNDIVQILDNKIHTETKLQSVFESDAILFAARKVAAVSGDIRKAIQICKAAAENVMLEVENGTRNDPKSSCERPVVRIKDIQRVTRERMGNVSSQSVRILSPMEVLVMVSITSLARNRGNMLGGFDIIDVVTKVESIANALGESMYLPPPVFHEILEIVNRLADARLIRLHTDKSSSNSFRTSQGGSGGSWPTITPAVDGSDILPALRLGLHTKLAERYLGNSIF
jgi:origin recognition complex subunit 1